MIEVVGSAVSIHQTKKQAGDTLLNYFYQQFGPPSSEGFLTAQVRTSVCVFVCARVRVRVRVLCTRCGFILLAYLSALHALPSVLWKCSETLPRAWLRTVSLHT